MDNSDKTSERTMRAHYLERINGLGKCLVLWAGQYSEFGSSEPWYSTEQNVNHLKLLIDEMATLAAHIDEKDSVQFWRYLKILITKER